MGQFKETTILEDIPVFEEILQTIDELEEMIWSFLSQKTNTANVQKVKEGKSHTIDLKRTLDWIRNKGYTITREDKTKRIVLMKRLEYDSFLINYINHTNANQTLVDPTPKLAARLERSIKNNMHQLS